MDAADFYECAALALDLLASNSILLTFPVCRVPSCRLQIGSDGTVTFGPNLSLLMSSLAVRFDDTLDPDESPLPVVHSAADSGAAGHRSARARDTHFGPTSNHVQTARTRADAKRREWHAMNALYARAIDEKQTSRDQAQWFINSTRFNYPIINQPNAAAMHAPTGVRQVHASDEKDASEQSFQTLHTPTAATATSAAVPSPIHAHLLHSSSAASFARPNVDTISATTTAVSVEEEPEDSYAYDV